ncbi:MAG TPA: hypothetical protein VJ947_02105 [Pseudohaliea sp.]|nr:hypothetical protein [Pseudohaliea sp.]
MRKTACVFIFALSAVSAAVLAQQPMPDGLFACHVLTSDERDGLVFVQAASAERARQVAGESDALVAGSPRVAAAKVIECVPRVEAEFKSAAANALLENLIL